MTQPSHLYLTMPQTDHAGREDQPVADSQRKVEALEDRVGALQEQSERSQRDQLTAEGHAERLRLHNAVLTRLSLSQTLAEGRVQEAYREICEAAAEALSVERVGIWFFDEDDRLLREVTVFDTRDSQFACRNVLHTNRYPRYFDALRQGRTVPANDARSDPRTCEMRDDYLIPCGVTSMLDAPIRIEGRVVGVICHEFHGPVRHWTVDEQNFAGSMGDFVSLMLQAERRRQTECKIEQQRTFLSQIVDITPNVVFVLDRDGRFVFVNQALSDLTGTAIDKLIGQVAVNFLPDEQRAAHLRQMDLEIIESKCDHLTSLEEFRDSQGGSHWFQIVKRPIMSMDGTETQVLGVAVDITERKRYEDRLAMLVRELDHRVKNNLFAVMIMAEQTAATSPSMEGFVSAFTGRIRAMSIAHEILAAANWQGAQLPQLIERLVEPFTVVQPQRVTVEGPPVLLPPPIAPAFCMILHELITNAATHGSLSAPNGTLDIHWQRQDGRLNLTWQEQDGPSINQPQRTGFGIELIKGTAEHQLRGEATLHFDEAGLRCEIGIPLESATRKESRVQTSEN